MKTKRIVTAPIRAAKALREMFFRPMTWRSWMLPSSVLNYAEKVGDGTGSSTVMAPLLWIMRNFPDAPPQLKRENAKGELEVEPRHDILRLLVRPNPHYSGTTLWMCTMLDWNVDGNAYWLKIRDQGGRVRELWWAPSWMIEPYGSERDFVSHYEYQLGAVTHNLASEDVVHFRFGLDPDNPRKGFSPLKSVLREIFTDDEAGAFTASLLKNSGVPGLLVSPKESGTTPNPDDVAATKAYLREAHIGDRRGEPLVMSGPTSIEQFGFSPEQLNLKALRRIPEERVTAVLGIPAIVAGLGAGLDRSTFANFAEARAAAYQENIVPSQRIIGEEIRFQLLPDFEADPWKFRIGFDTSGVQVLQEDQEKRAKRLDVGVRGGWIQVAEARREMGLEARADDEIYLRQFSTLEVPAGESGRTIELDQAAKSVVDNPYLTAEQREPTQIARVKGKRATRELAQLMVELEKQAMKLEAAFAEQLEADFDKLGELAAEAFEQVATGLSPDALSASSNGQRKASDISIAERVVAAMDLDGWKNDRLVKSYTRHYERTATSTVSTINSILTLGIQMPDEVMRRIIYRGGTRLALLETTKQTRDAIIRAVAQGREAALGPIEIARQIREAVPAGPFTSAGPAYRAKLIARTETKFAQNVSSLEAYGGAENVTAVIAFDNRLGYDDADCVERDGETFTVEQAEAELAQEHPNGTLSFAPVVAETLSEIGA